MHQKTLTIALFLLCSCETSTRLPQKPVPQPHKTNLIDLYAKANGIPPLLARAVIHTESSGYSKATRFESHWLKRCKGDRNCATSFGLGQVMGFHAKSLGIAPTDLLDEETNIWAFTKILGTHLKRQNWLLLDSEKTRRALIAYNGSQTYPRRIKKSLEFILEKRYGAATLERNTRGNISRRPNS